MTVLFQSGDGADTTPVGDDKVTGTEVPMVITDTTLALDDCRSRVSLEPAGEIDAGTVGALAEAVHDALLSGAHEIDLDLRLVPFMDTAAVEVLQVARESLEGVGGVLCVRNATPSVRRLLALTAFTPSREGDR